MTIRAPRKTSENCRRLPKAWFSLTARERLAVLVVLGLFLLGLGARYWHLVHEHAGD